ncbi:MULTISPECIES: WecB/TagA/CpsF family glycosyltransferase [Clostridia]|jgi:N-acetylglucosaminyldiphosphoundecaprenol N-acetyl-beta-D-mannosaminyltransferase|uniref:WecB/TagA/CpsF family glycosyltransferase n=1 Tax=Clostridia TaxID=186801 RepID=UPI001FAA2DB9|nr:MULTISPECIES: WecB/TagA/CpsF family glycosyltransferase [Clostridia]
MQSEDLKVIDNKNVIDFLGIRLNNMTEQEILDYVDYCISRKTPCQIVGVNVDQALRVIEDEYSGQIFKDAEIVFTDGKPIIWMAKWLKRPIVEKVSGPDLMLKLCERAAEKKYKVFLLGAGPGVAAQAVVNLEKLYPGLQCVGTYSPPFGFEKDKEEMEKIVSMLRDSKADQLFVGMGSPKQDIFIYENMNEYQIPVSCSMGAAIDFIGGGAKRAPKWMSDYGLEWFHRFLQNPKRLYRRYFVDDRRILKYYFEFRKREKAAGRL